MMRNFAYLAEKLLEKGMVSETFFEKIKPYL